MIGLASYVATDCKLIKARDSACAARPRALLCSGFKLRGRGRPGGRCPCPRSRQEAAPTTARAR
eukprot:6144111-Alexandrium_andersonii.AAC.1